MTQIPDPTSASTQPLTAEAVGRIVQECISRERDYFKFAQDQSERDRAYFTHLFDRAMYFLGALIVAAGIFGYRSVDQMKDDVRARLDAEVQKAQGQLQSTTADANRKVQEQVSLTGESVKQRVDDQFQTERITEIVGSVATKHSDAVIARLVEPVRKQVEELQLLALIGSKVPDEPLNSPIDRRSFEEVIAVANDESKSLTLRRGAEDVANRLLRVSYSYANRYYYFRNDKETLERQISELTRPERLKETLADADPKVRFTALENSNDPSILRSFPLSWIGSRVNRILASSRL